MRSITLLLLPVAALALVPNLSQQKTTKLVTADASRRDVFVKAGALLAFTLSPKIANAFSQQLDDAIIEPAQLNTDGRLDLNAAFVGEYKQLPGMFPHAAGKIASHGPYQSVRDIYKIPDITDHDKAMFKKYEKAFTTNPPGRAFHFTFG